MARARALSLSRKPAIHSQLAPPTRAQGRLWIAAFPAIHSQLALFPCVFFKYLSYAFAFFLAAALVNNQKKKNVFAAGDALI